MRYLILFSILLPAISCQSTKQAVTESDTSIRADSVIASSVDSSAIDISSIRADLEIDLSGISIFYCAETEAEDTIPSFTMQQRKPRSIHIAHASIKSSSRASSLKSTKSSATDSAAVRSDMRAGQKRQSDSEINKHTASATALKFLLPAILILIAVFFIRKIRSPT